MTSQTKHYIDIKDLIAFRCECKRCGASLSLPLKPDAERAIEVCPSCNKTWLEGIGKKEFALLLRQIETVKTLAGTLGFNLSFEVSGPVSSDKD